MRLKKIATAVALVLWSSGCGASRSTATSPAPAQAEPQQAEAAVAATSNSNAASDVSRPAGAHAPATAEAPEDLPALEQAAYEKARPVFDEHCARCHGSDGKRGARKHFDMTKYPFEGHHAMEITATIREVLGVSGGEASMPEDKPGAVQGDQLSLINAWADAFDRTHAAGLHGSHPPSDDGQTKHAH